MVKAISGLQVGNKAPAIEYLRYVESRRGRECAEETKARLISLAKGKAFANAHEILSQLGKTPMEFLD